MSDASEVKQKDIHVHHQSGKAFILVELHNRIVAELKTDVARLCETVRYLESTNPQLTDAEKTIAKLRAEVARQSSVIEKLKAMLNRFTPFDDLKTVNQELAAIEKEGEE